jgi:hypothetical protein
MKKQAYMIITVIMLVAIAGLSTAKAQTSGNPQLIANIPFAFSVGNKTMPAGEYTVSCANPASDMKVLQLRSKDGRAGVLVQTSSVIGKLQDSAKLVFNRYGDHYFFAQAWLPADNIGMQASKSRSEKQFARELAREKRTTETVLATTRR